MCASVKLNKHNDENIHCTQIYTAHSGVFRSLVMGAKTAV